MRTPIYCRMIDDALGLPGEADRLQWISNPPAIGDRVTLGKARLWEVIEVHQFRSDEGGQACIAYCHPMGLTVPDRATWLDWEMFERDRKAKTLSLYTLDDGQVFHWEHSFRGEKPRIGEQIEQFDIATRKPTATPWATESYATYLPVNPSETPFTALYLADLIAIDLGRDEAAIVLEPELVGAGG